jgi:hypothetical protein
MRSARFIACATVGMVAAGLIGGMAANPQGALAAAAKDSRTFMKEVVAPATQVLWDFGYAEKMTDQDWDKVKKAAVDLTGAMSTINAGGVTAADRARSKEAGWQEWAKKLGDSASAAKTAADAKNQMELASAGDSMVEICEGCHMAYDPTAK